MRDRQPEGGAPVDERLQPAEREPGADHDHRHGAVGRELLEQPVGMPGDHRAGRRSAAEHERTGRLELHVADNEALRNNSPSFPFAAFPNVAASHPDNPYGTDVRFIGRIIGAGDYVFEPEGNVDSWQAVGDEVLILHVVVRGDVDYVAADGTVQRHITTADVKAGYQAFCAERGLLPKLG